MSLLQTRHDSAIEAEIGKAKDSRDRETVEALDGAEAHSYPHREGRIA